MSETTKPDAVEALISKAVDAQNADHALKYSQAACNAANARSVVHNDLNRPRNSRE